MTLNYDTRTQKTIHNSRKGAKTSNEDSKKISRNKMNSKIVKCVNSWIKSGIKGIKNNSNKKLKPKIGEKINLKSRIENNKTVLRRKLIDSTQTGDELNLSQKAKNAGIPRSNPYENIPSLLNISKQ